MSRFQTDKCPKLGHFCPVLRCCLKSELFENGTLFRASEIRTFGFRTSTVCYFTCFILSSTFVISCSFIVFNFLTSSVNSFRLRLDEVEDTSVGFKDGDFFGDDVITWASFSADDCGWRWLSTFWRSTVMELRLGSDLIFESKVEIISDDWSIRSVADF